MVRLTEESFPLTQFPTGRQERAYAWRFYPGRAPEVVEKYTTNFDAAVSQVNALRARGVVVLTYSIFV